MTFTRVVLFAAAVSLLVPAAALAKGKVGLWSSTTTMTATGLPAQSRAATYCMTAAEVASNTPSDAPGCAYSNVTVNGRTFSADMVCSGQVSASGHTDTTYDTDTHYTSTVTMNVQGATLVNSVEGRWLKDDCSGAQH